MNRNFILPGWLHNRFEEAKAWAWCPELEQKS